MTQAVLTKPGTLIRCRGREWVVLPESSDELLMARPVGGLDEEITGILPAIEPVESATFNLPGRDDIGDFTSCRLLRDAARLSTRAAAGPFRSFARIAVEPRPYQLVPLMMALRLDPVRLLIADDVGIGKTIEAVLIAREMLDRGEIQRFAVLCPPHLAQQWQKELAEKFHIDAELVLSSTIQRLERDLPIGVSVFDIHRFTVVSTDFIKSDRHAADFELKCPELVIVDEAHGCTLAGGLGRGRQQRFDLIRKISLRPDRHMVLVTATPHSGNEQAFRSLLSLLDKEFNDLPIDIVQDARSAARRKLAQHLVQRRRDDIRHYLATDTAFPTRLDKEGTYSFGKEYKTLFDDIIKFAREFIADAGQTEYHRRLRYWSALALLRCVSSSPAAAVATLTNRSGLELVADNEIDEYGRRTILDIDDLDAAFSLDTSPGSESENNDNKNKTKLLEFARRCKALTGEADAKLQGAIREVKALVKEGYQPIVFCRFMDTSDYVAREMRKALPNSIRVESVTGMLPPSEREARIENLVQQGGNYVLVCTDCLSEGINLQQHFNAVLHYDLTWNPTRHEQREGRVDRFGQKKEKVRVITYYGKDNPIDGVILDVLIRKHKSIKNDLGVTVAVPGSSEEIAQALFEGALFRKMTTAEQLSFDFGESTKSMIKEFHHKWDDAKEKEKTSRSRFAQFSLDQETVAAELATVRAAIGSKEDVARFFHQVLHFSQVPVKDHDDAVTVHISPETPRAMRQAIGYDEKFIGRFDLPLRDGEIYLGRTSPIIEGLAAWTLDQALDPMARDRSAIAARCGVISTAQVRERMTLILARFRYHLHSGVKMDQAILCEEIIALACTGTKKDLHWLTEKQAEELLSAKPEQNLIRTAIDQQVGLLLESFDSIRQALAEMAGQRAEQQLQAHSRVREAVKLKGRVTIEPVLPVDILGAYILLPRL